MCCFPFPGPTEPTDPEELVGGWLAAAVAELEGRTADVRRLLTTPDGTLRRRAHGFPVARALLAEGEFVTLRDLLDRLETHARVWDDLLSVCGCGHLRSSLALAEGHAREALGFTEVHLLVAEELGLGLRRTDLLVARSSALLALGLRAEAREAARLALDSVDGDRTGARAAIAALRAAGGAADDAVAEPVTTPVAPAIHPPRDLMADRAPPRDSVEQRSRLHADALELLKAYDERGMPFALSLRNYHITVHHGPFERGAQYVETMIRRALPAGAGVLTIQDQGDIAIYTGSGSSADRGAASLLLPDDEWREIVAGLIPFADLIVSEPYMLTEAVRFELDTARHHGSWDRTVVVLPPLNSPFATLDSDPLIQMFPRCVWADTFHTTSFEDLPVVADLLQRMRDLTALPDAERAPTDDRLIGSMRTRSTAPPWRAASKRGWRRTGCSAMSTTWMLATTRSGPCFGRPRYGGSKSGGATWNTARR